MIRLISYCVFILIHWSLLTSMAWSADLLFGNSGDDPRCAGTIQTTYPFAESIYHVRSIRHGGTSLDPDFSFIELVWPRVISQATHAAISHDQRTQGVVYQQLLTLAKNGAVLNTIGRESVELCYVRGPDQPCNFQAYMMAFQYFSYYAYTAWLIKPYIDQQPDRHIINQYLKRGYERYVRTYPDPRSDGIFALLNGYIGIYSYAMYMDDQRLALWSIREGIGVIRQQLADDGYIRFSSFRGTRAYFYHTMAVDSILSFGELAERRGFSFHSDAQLRSRLRHMVEVTLKYAADPQAFESRGSRLTNDGRVAFTTVASKAKRVVHSQALALPILINKRYSDLVIDPDIMRHFPRKDFGYHIDMIAGFVPRCLEMVILDDP